MTHDTEAAATERKRCAAELRARANEESVGAVQARWLRDAAAFLEAVPVAGQVWRENQTGDRWTVDAVEGESVHLSTRGISPSGMSDRRKTGRADFRARYTLLSSLAVAP
jgi:hypothetical protein